MTPGSRPLRAAALGSVVLLFVAAVASNPASAQQPPGEAAGAGTPRGEGRIAGRVTDNQTGAGIEGVTVVLTFPAPPDGGAAHQELQVTDSDGNYAFASVPAGGYRIEFLKTGHGAASITDVEVVSGRESRADSAISQRAGATAEGGEAGSAPPDAGPVESITVHGVTAADLLGSIEQRQEADQLVNLLSAEEIAKFAAGDMAEAIKRVAGINIVEGQFAIIRGLEERYSSTLFNGAVVPSPDPNRQSIQLDLFASDIVSNLSVSKTFGQNLPGNSSGGSIDILTHGYPKKWTASFSAGGGFNDNALDRFIRYHSSSATGTEADSDDVIESEFGGSLGGSFPVGNREARLKVVVNREIDYETLEGVREERQPAGPVTRRNVVLEPGDLALGELNRSNGRFDLTESRREQQDTLFGAFGFDLDPGGRHKLDVSAYYTSFDDESVEVFEDGYIPFLDYQGLSLAQQSTSDRPRGDLFTTSTRPTAKPPAAANAWIINGGVGRESYLQPRGRGSVWFSNFGQSTNIRRERELTLVQLNGGHAFESLDGLTFDWVGNYATTTQTEEASRLRYSFEPCGFEDSANFCPSGVSRIPIPNPMPPPIRVADLGPGEFNSRLNQASFSDIDIEETQYFGRADTRYERSLTDFLEGEVSAGGWYEQAERDVLSTFDPGVDTDAAYRGATLDLLGRNVMQLRPTQSFKGDQTNESTRDIWALHGGSKLTFFEILDLYGGLRFENILIESKNDPFTDEPPDPAFPTVNCPGGLAVPEETPRIFPSRYLLFDRLDNCAREDPESGSVNPSFAYNDLILGIPVPVDPATGVVDIIGRQQQASLLEGEIDETYYLPAAGVALRPLEGLALRGAYSQTVARPSFRELGYYVSTQSGDDKFEVGNPHLQLSEVESWDARVEYFGEYGDLAALSFFVKTIEDPIEAILLADYQVRDNTAPEAFFKTFFNNSNAADLLGVEVEARKTLDFFLWGWEPLQFLEFFSVGGNFTYIDAEIERSDVERRAAQGFFTPLADPAFQPWASGLERKRRLFNQPEWIANADITFDQPDWGTQVTLAYFAISDVLKAVGGGNTAGGSPIPINSLSGGGFIYTLDRYEDEYYQLDLIASQSFVLPGNLGEITFKTSIKNLTDTTRRIIYDPEQLRHKVAEREFKRGLDYSFALQYSFEFDSSMFDPFRFGGER